MTRILLSEAQSRAGRAVRDLFLAHGVPVDVAGGEMAVAPGVTLIVTDLAPALMAGTRQVAGPGPDRLAQIDVLLRAVAAQAGRIVLISGPQMPDGEPAASDVERNARQLESAVFRLAAGRGIILRASDVMDPNDIDLRVALRSLIEGNPAAAWPVTDPVQVIGLADLAAATVAAAQARGIEGRAFDIVHPEAAYRFVVQSEAQRMARLLVDPDATDGQNRPAYPAATPRRDGAAAAHALHVRPQTSIFVLLAQTIQGMVAESVRHGTIAPIRAAMPAVDHALETGALPLAGSTAVVTGATGQIGRAVTRMLVRLGANVTGVARRADAGAEMERAFAGERDFLQRQRQRLDAERMRRDGGAPVVGEPGRFRFMQGDLGENAALKAVATRLAAELPRINILIHAAGAIRRDRQENAQKVEAVLALHMLAPIALTRLLAEPLRRAGSAWVINPVTALHQFYPYDLNDLQSRNRYEPAEVLARAHAGLVALTGALAVGMTGTGVNIAAVALAQVRTPLLLRLEGPLTGSVVEQHIAKTRREQQRAAMDTPAHAARQIVEVMLGRQFADAHGSLINGGRVEGPILTHGTDLDRLDALWTASAALSGLPE